MALSHLLLFACLCCAVLPVTSIAGSTGVLKGAVKPKPGNPDLAPPDRKINPYYPHYYPWPIYKPSCCPAGWTRLWNRCFMYHRRPKSWTDAEKACIRLGGNLASIRGTVENRFVKKMVNRVTCSNQPIWIGGFDSASEGIWLWSDGARFYNYSWAKKVKKNKSEQCLLFHLIGTYWKDQKCEKKFSYVCSMTLK